MSGALVGAAATALTVKSVLASPLGAAAKGPLDDATKSMANATNATVSAPASALSRAGDGLQGAIVGGGQAAPPPIRGSHPTASPAAKPGAASAAVSGAEPIRPQLAEAPHGAGPAYSRPLVVQILRQAAARQGVDQRLILALSYWESGWDQSRVSATGAVGLMQVEPATAQEAGPSLLGRNVDVNDPYDNADTGVAIFKEDLANFGSPEMALAAYYQGPTSLQANGMLPDTQQYVEGILDLAKRIAP